MSIPLPSLHHLFQNNENENNNYSNNTSTTTTKNIHVNDLYLTSDERYEIYLVKLAERPHLLHYDHYLSKEQQEEQEYPYQRNEKIEEKKSSFCEHYHNHDNNHNNIISSKTIHYDPPLIDGCDIPGWRKENLVSSFINNDSTTTTKTTNSTNDIITINHEIQSLLNIGPSSTMFRLESQWPNIQKMITNNDINTHNFKWKELQMKLVKSVKEENNAKIVNYKEYCQKVKVSKMVVDDSNDFEVNSSSNSSSSTCSSSREEKDYRMVTKFAIEFEQKNIPAKVLGATIGWKCMPNNNSLSAINNDDEHEHWVDKSWT